MMRMDSKFYVEMGKSKERKLVMTVTLWTEMGAVVGAKWRMDGTAKATAHLIQGPIAADKSTGTVTVGTELSKETRSVMTDSL